MKQVKATRHPWLIACDANLSPEDFEKSMWFQSRQMFFEAPREGELIERTYYVIASHSLSGRITQMKMGVEGFEIGPHKAVSFEVERDKRGARMERTGDASGAAWLQRRLAARKKHNEKMQRR